MEIVLVNKGKSSLTMFQALALYLVSLYLFNNSEGGCGENGVEGSKG